MKLALNILVINGPNLNMLGYREKSIYGEESLADIERKMSELARDLGVDIDLFQSNHEGAIIDKIQASYKKADVIIINAGALTHYSIAIHDALKAVNIPVIEVHISNIYRREDYRLHSYISPVAVGGIFGFGPMVYTLAIKAAVDLFGTDNKHLTRE